MEAFLVLFGAGLLAGALNAAVGGGSFVSIPAGVLEVPFDRYVLLTLAGAAIWCLAFAGAGYAAGESWTKLHHAFAYLDYLIVLAVVLGIGWLVVRRLRRRRVAEDSAG